MANDLDLILEKLLRLEGMINDIYLNIIGDSYEPDKSESERSKKTKEE